MVGDKVNILQILVTANYVNSNFNFYTLDVKHVALNNTKQNLTLN